MKQENIVPILGIILFTSAFLYLVFFKTSKGEQPNVVMINGKKIEVEIADTPAKLTQGLMFRKELGENSGMLFIFSNLAKHSFWMANTLIPLDIIWLNENKEIVYISADTPPCTETGNVKALCKSYSPGKDAKYVLEVNGGWTSKNGVLVGQKAEFN